MIEARDRVESDSPSPVTLHERIHAVDILRGFAVLGMILVHFHFYANDFHELPGRARTTVESVISWAIWLLVETKSAATFTFLFGVGFAIQLQRAKAWGGPFISIYLRRLLVLGLFGFAAHAFFGFNILLSYAYGGLWLLFVRTWSPRALLVAVVLSAMLPSLYATGRRAYDWAVPGAEQAIAADNARGEASRERAASVQKGLEAAEAQSNYTVTVLGRLHQMKWFYAQRFFILPGSTLCLFLLGMLALRCGIIADPDRWVRVIASFMGFGVAAWATGRWLLPLWEPQSAGVWLLEELWWGLGFANEQWLAFTYIGAFLLVAAYRTSWLRRCAPLAWVGRLSLTNYLLQIVVLDVLFAGYGFKLEIREIMVLPATLLLFGAEAWLSQLWLWRFRLGPAEWLWRSLSYGRLQALARS